MNNKFIKIFSATSFCVIFIISTACSTVTGAYSDDPYGPIVDCDANLPIDDLLKCVDKRYADMDSINEPKNITDIKFHLKSGKHRPADFGIESKNIHPQKINTFKSLKSCFLRDENCFKLRNGRKVPCLANENNCKRSINGSDVSIDQYKKTMAIAQETSFNGFYKNNDKGINPPKSSEFGNWSTSVFNVSYPYRFLRSKKINAKDLIIAKNNEKTIVFTIGVEGVKLKEKDLLGVKILGFCNITPEQEGYKKATKESYCKLNENGQKRCISNDAKDSLFELCQAYDFWVFGNMEKTKDNVAISLDKRINPTQVFIKLGEDIYKINLIEGESNN